MNPQIALEYAQRKLKELNVNENYTLDFRHITVQDKETIEIEATNQFYYLVDGFATTFRISSETGVYDLTDTLLSELKHEHTGKINIQNRVTPILHLQFIVVTPLLEQPPKTKG